MYAMDIFHKDGHCNIEVNLSWTGKLSRYSDIAMGWSVRGSNPVRGRDFSHPSRRTKIMTTD